MHVQLQYNGKCFWGGGEGCAEGSPARARQPPLSHRQSASAILGADEELRGQQPLPPVAQTLLRSPTHALEVASTALRVQRGKAASAPPEPPHRASLSHPPPFSSLQGLGGRVALPGWGEGGGRSRTCTFRFLSKEILWPSSSTWTALT